MPHNDDRRRPNAVWLRAALAAVLAGGLGAALWFARSKGAAPAGKLDGKLTVLVRPPDRNTEPVALDQPDALPVQHGGAMCLDARLEDAAFVYLLWIDPQGQVLPLYPWNNESLEVTDADQQPPLRRPAKLVFSPLLGRNWTFGDVPGTETVLLLARRTPLPAEVQLGALLKKQSSPPQIEGPENFIAARLNPADKSRPAAKQPSGSDRELALARFLEPLGEHFDLVRAVQFGHAAK